MLFIKNKKLLRKYRKLYQIAKPTMTKDHEEQFDLAFKMIVDTYAKQDLKNIDKALRAISMAKIVAKDLGLGMTAICCAILYSIIDHPDMSAIQEKFGTLVAQIVVHLCSIKDYPKEAQKAFLKQLLSSSVKYPRVMLIKIAESLHNMRSIHTLTQERQQEVIATVKWLYMPMAHRLGFYALKTAFEDLLLKHTHPQIYQRIHEQIQHTRQVKQGFFQRFLRPLQGRLKQYGIDYKVKSRVKSVASVWAKMNKQQLTVATIYDLFALRIILDTPPGREELTCWQVYGIVTGFYTPKPKRLRDWLSHPRDNGYQALHTTVNHEGEQIEVQIRSRHMDDLAERGSAAHWRYKNADQTEYWDIVGLEAYLDQLRELLAHKSQYHALVNQLSLTLLS